MSTTTSTSTPATVASVQSVREQWEAIVRDHSDKIGWATVLLVPLGLLVVALTGTLPVAVVVTCLCGWLLSAVLVKNLISMIIFRTCTIGKAWRIAAAFLVTGLIGWTLFTNAALWMLSVSTVVVLLVLEWCARSVISFEEFEEEISVPPQNP